MQENLRHRQHQADPGNDGQHHESHRNHHNGGQHRCRRQTGGRLAVDAAHGEAETADGVGATAPPNEHRRADEVSAVDAARFWLDICITCVYFVTQECDCFARRPRWHGGTAQSTGPQAEGRRTSDIAQQ